MPLPDDGPCEPWCTWDEVKRCVSTETAEALDTVASEIREDLIAEASEILYNLSGRYYPGTCSATRNICRTCVCAQPWSCCCRDRFRLAVDLGDDWPVARVTSVVVDGATLVAGTDYRVDDWRYLVRLGDAADPWPTGSDLDDPTAFQVTWEWGRAIPRAGRRSAARFVAEFAKDCIDDDDCQLPERVTTVVREGVTYTIMDSMKMIDEGRTGLYFVDLWLKSDKLGREDSSSSMIDPADPSYGNVSALGTDSGAS